MANPTPQQIAFQQNAAARGAVLNMAVPMCQQMFSQNLVPALTPQVTVYPRNVGLIRGFWVKVVHTISNASGGQATLTEFGAAHALSQIQFNDLQNLTRIQTSGWHLAFINAAKSRRVFGAQNVISAQKNDTTNSSAAAPNQFPIDYNPTDIFKGASVPWVNQILATPFIADDGTGTVCMWYYVPLAYSDTDLRGAIYANVVQATMQLILSFPGSNGVQLAAVTGADSTLALYTAASTANIEITNTLVTVYQEYFDQLPVANGVVLPLLDLATIYDLKQTIQTGITAGQDFGYQYANFRDILSTIAVYVNTGATGARSGGADMNYWALQSANATNIWKKEPGLIALQNRNFMSADWPNGVYYFDTRKKPISTTQYGNMQLIMNPITAGAGAYQLVGVEDFALAQQLSMAGSLASS